METKVPVQAGQTWRCRQDDVEAVVLAVPCRCVSHPHRPAAAYGHVEIRRSTCDPRRTRGTCVRLRQDGTIDGYELVRKAPNA